MVEIIEYTVEELIAEGVLEKPLDGNHGSIHPKGDDFRESGVPFIMASDLHNGVVDLVTCKFISPAQAKSLRKGFAKPGDVLLTHKATIGRTAIVSDIQTDFIMLTPQVTYYRIKAPSRLNNRYLKYYFDSKPFQDLFTRWAGGGSTRAYLGITGQRKLPIKVPPIETQRDIISVLGALDDKIHLNRQINQTLESIAQTLFKSWFVDFDPVKAKMEGREPEGMDAETAALFPDRLVESELGMIPEGWEIKSLSGIATFLNGLAMQKYPAIEGESYYPVLKIAELRAGFGERTNRANTGVPGAYIVQDGDIIFSWSGSLLVKQWSLGEAALNQHLFKVTSESYPKWFYYQWILHHLSEFQSIAAGKATTMGHIQRKHLDEAEVLVPSQDLMRAADSILRPILEMQLENDLNSGTLGELRDTLLPGLISGEIQIPTEPAI